MKLLLAFLLCAASVFAQHKNTLTATCSGTCQTQPDGVSAINFYRSSVAGSGYVKISTTPVVSVTGTPIVVSFADLNVVPGQTLYYVATVSNPGGESSYSVPTSCTTPFQTPATPPSLSSTVN